MKEFFIKLKDIQDETARRNKEIYQALSSTFGDKLSDISIDYSWYYAPYQLG